MYYAVSSGNILRCVQADDLLGACVAAVLAHHADYMRNRENDPVEPGAIFEAIREGATVEQSEFILTDTVMRAAEFVFRNVESN